jgi:hypothetical protein
LAKDFSLGKELVFKGLTLEAAGLCCFGGIKVETKMMNKDMYLI